MTSTSTGSRELPGLTADRTSIGPVDTAAIDTVSIEMVADTLSSLRPLLIRAPRLALRLPGLGDDHLEMSELLACEAVHDLSSQRAENDPPSVKDVSLALHLDQSTVSRLMGECETAGLMVRGPHPADARRTALHLTPAGLRVAEHARRFQCDILAGAFATWSDADLALFSALLGRFAEDLHATMNALEPEPTGNTRSTCLPSRLARSILGKKDLRRSP